jgi:hypothetical protein
MLYMALRAGTDPTADHPFVLTRSLLIILSSYFVTLRRFFLLLN